MCFDGTEQFKLYVFVLVKVLSLASFFSGRFNVEFIFKVMQKIYPTNARVIILRKQNRIA